MEDYDDDFDSPTVKKGKVTATKTAPVNKQTPANSKFQATTEKAKVM